MQCERLSAFAHHKFVIPFEGDDRILARSALFDTDRDDEIPSEFSFPEQSFDGLHYNRLVVVDHAMNFVGYDFVESFLIFELIHNNSPFFLPGRQGFEITI